MKRTVLYAVIFTTAAVFLLSGCKGPAGDVFIAYDWGVNTPASISSTDPSIPARIFPGAYYQTLPGSYYVQYSYASYPVGSYRYLSYTLTPIQGKPGFQPGDDAQYTVWLNESSNPTMVLDVSPRTAVSPGVPNPAGVPQSPVSPGGKHVQQFEYTETLGAYNLHVQGGVIQPGQ
jgi:hypothetical protein